MKALFLRTALSLIVAVAGSSALAQTAASGASENMHGLKMKELHPRSTPTPFPLEAHTGRRQELEFREPQAMTAVDRELVAANETEIARRADLQGFHLDGDRGGGWGYEQAVCPVFPEHVVLEYSRINGAGDVSLFSVVIPRGEGHVRVIPARRRSYSLWTPAPSNALTINDFNHMVKENPDGLSPDWLTLGLCYSALAAGHVRAGLIGVSRTEEHFPLAPAATLAVSGKGGAEVRFSDTTAGTREMTWVMEFSQSGRLLKVRHGNTQELVEKPVKESVIDLGKPGN